MEHKIGGNFEFPCATTYFAPLEPPTGGGPIVTELAYPHRRRSSSLLHQVFQAILVERKGFEPGALSYPLVRFPFRKLDQILRYEGDQKFGPPICVMLVPLRRIVCTNFLIAVNHSANVV